MWPSNRIVGSAPVRIVSGGVFILGLVAFAQSLAWRDARFPGFFLMPNRVVPSAGLPHWNGARDGRPLYQQVLVAVDEAPVETSAEGYARASAHQVGETVRYTFIRDAALEVHALPVRRFTGSDYLATFGMYVASGLAYLLLAMLAAERWRESAFYRGLACFAWVSAVFVFTAIDLYGPGRFFRLHVLAEALLPAAAAHLALTCPRRGSSAGFRPMTLVYGLALALAAAYELFLFEPRAYTAMHDASQALACLPVLAFTVVLGLALAEPPPALGAWGVNALFAGALVGIVLPGVIFAISGISGGLVPVHVAAWFGLAFPLACVLALWMPRPRAAVSLAAEGA